LIVELLVVGCCMRKWGKWHSRQAKDLII